MSMRACLVTRSSRNPVGLSLALILLAALPARAQSPYVGASVFADVVRSSGDESSDVGRGEALGGALRVGTSLGASWGVELEFTRSGEIEWHPDVTILTTLRIVPTLVPNLPDVAIFPRPEITIESQLSALTTSVWWRQRVNRRLDLVYLGGVAFTRSNLESEVIYELPPIPRTGQALPTRLYASEFTDYDTGVSVGFEAAIAMTDKLRLVPGVRMLAIDSQWIIRPGVGMQWRF
jgi:hypothetical protein